jgi:hypothetical protein
VIVCFVDIDGSFVYHRLSFLFIIIKVKSRPLKVEGTGNKSKDQRDHMA